MAGLREAFDRSVNANQQLVADLDDAVVEAGRTIADRVDAAIRADREIQPEDPKVQIALAQEVTKSLYLLPHLMNVLREMHATPDARLKANLG